MLVVLVAKFVDGAWITMLLIPATAGAHVRRASALPTRKQEVADSSPINLAHFRQAMVVVPLERWSAVAKKAVTFALSMSPDVIGLHVNCEWTEELKKEWQDFVEKPAQELGWPRPGS